MDERKKTAVLLENAKRKGIYFDFLALVKITVAVLTALIFSAAGVSGNAYFFTSYTAGGVALFAVTYLFCKVYGLDFKEETAIKRADGKYYLLSALLLAAMFFGLSGFNGYFISFLEKNFGYKPSEVVLPELSAVNYIAVVLTVCVMPAVTEEFAFRGVMLGGVKSGGKIGSAIAVAFAFALYHASPAQTVYQFAVGITFALLAYKSKSIFPTIIVHFLNNFIIVNVYYFCGGGLDFGETANLILTISGLCFTAAFLYFTLKKDGEEPESNFAAKWYIIRNFIKYGLFGILAYVALWIISFIG